MSIKELDRLDIIKKCADKTLSQDCGSSQLSISERHLRRLVSSFRLHGVDALISKHRGDHRITKYQMLCVRKH